MLEWAIIGIIFVFYWTYIIVKLLVIITLKIRKFTAYL